MTNERRRFAGVELGGTKTICGLAIGDQLVETITLPTTTPSETLSTASRQLADWHRAAPLAGLGIASFGPICLDPTASDYGQILTTPKQGWSGTAVLEWLAADRDVPTGIDTDVNAAAVAEYRWGAGQGCSSLVYLTIGTGLGGGVLIDGRPLHGRLHPEIGHILLRRSPGDSFPGVCPFHGDCIEGLVSGPALAARFGAPATDIARDAAEWSFVANDLSQLLATVLHVLAPQRILIGGGVGLGIPQLLPLVLRALPRVLADYFPDLDTDRLELMIRSAGLGSSAGALGAIAVAQRAAAVPPRVRRQVTSQRPPEDEG
jgi:fructokinase